MKIKISNSFIPSKLTFHQVSTKLEKVMASPCKTTNGSNDHNIKFPNHKKVLKYVNGEPVLVNVHTDTNTQLSTNINM